MTNFFHITLRNIEFASEEDVYLTGELPKYTNFDNFFHEHLYKTFTDTLEKLRTGKLIKAKSVYTLYVETIEYLINEKGFTLVTPQNIYFDYTDRSDVYKEDMDKLKKICVKFCKEGYSGMDRQIDEYNEKSSL